MAPAPEGSALHSDGDNEVYSDGDSLDEVDAVLTQLDDDTLSRSSTPSSFRTAEVHSPMASYSTFSSSPTAARTPIDTDSYSAHSSSAYTRSTGNSRTSFSDTGSRSSDTRRSDSESTNIPSTARTNSASALVYSDSYATETDPRTSFATSRSLSATVTSTMETHTRTASTPPRLLRSPAAPIRSLVARWKERTSPSLRSPQSPPSPVLQTVDDWSAAAALPGVDLAELRKYAGTLQPPLHGGRLWYLHVHSTSPARWLLCSALFYPHALLLSWPGIGHGNAGVIALDIRSCEGVARAGSDPVGDAAVDAQRAAGEALPAQLFALHVLYADGVERLATANDADREEWAGLIWPAGSDDAQDMDESLFRSVSVLDSFSGSPTPLPTASTLTPVTSSSFLTWSQSISTTHLLENSPMSASSISENFTLTASPTHSSVVPSTSHTPRSADYSTSQSVTLTQSGSYTPYGSDTITSSFTSRSSVMSRLSPSIRSSPVLPRSPLSSNASEETGYDIYRSSDLSDMTGPSSVSFSRRDTRTPTPQVPRVYIPPTHMVRSPLSGSESGYDICVSSDMTDLTGGELSLSATPRSRRSATLSVRSVASSGKYVTASQASSEVEFISLPGSSATSFVTADYASESDAYWTASEPGEYETASEMASESERALSATSLPLLTPTPTLSSLHLWESPRISPQPSTVSSAEWVASPSPAPVLFPLPPSPVISVSSISSPPVVGTSRPPSHAPSSPSASLLSDLHPADIPLPRSVPVSLYVPSPRALSLPLSSPVSAPSPTPSVHIPTSPSAVSITVPLSPLPAVPSPSLTPSVGSDATLLPPLPPSPMSSLAPADIPLPRSETESVSSPHSSPLPGHHSILVSLASDESPSLSTPPPTLSARTEVEDLRTPTSVGLLDLPVVVPSPVAVDVAVQEDTISLLSSLPRSISTHDATAVVESGLESPETVSTLPFAPSPVLVRAASVASSSTWSSTTSSSSSISESSLLSSSISSPPRTAIVHRSPRTPSDVSYDSSILRPSTLASLHSDPFAYERDMSSSYSTSPLRPTISAVSSETAAPRSPLLVRLVPLHEPSLTLSTVSSLSLSRPDVGEVATPSSLVLSSSFSSLGSTSMPTTSSSLGSTSRPSTVSLYAPSPAPVASTSPVPVEDDVGSLSSITTVSSLSIAPSSSSPPASAVLGTPQPETPDATISVSISTPHGSGETGILADVPSAASSSSSVTEPDIPRAIERASEVLRKGNEARGGEVGVVRDALGELRNELRDLASYLRRPGLAPPRPQAVVVQEERRTAPAHELETVEHVDMGVGESRPVSSVYMLTTTNVGHGVEAPGSPISSDAGSFIPSEHSDDHSDVISFLPSEHSDDSIWDMSAPSSLTKRTVEGTPELGTITTSSSESIMPSSPSTPVSPPSSVSFGAPPRALESDPLPAALQSVQDALREIRDSQAKTDSAVAALDLHAAPRADSRINEVRERVRRIEELVATLASQQRDMPSPAPVTTMPPPIASLPSIPRSTRESAGSEWDEYLRLMTRILDDLTRDQAPGPTTYTPQTDWAALIREGSRSEAPVPPHAPTPHVDPFAYPPHVGVRSVSRSPSPLRTLSAPVYPPLYAYPIPGPYHAPPPRRSTLRRRERDSGRRSAPVASSFPSESSESSEPIGPPHQGPRDPVWQGQPVSPPRIRTPPPPDIVLVPGAPPRGPGPVISDRPPIAVPQGPTPQPGRKGGRRPQPISSPPVVPPRNDYVPMPAGPTVVQLPPLFDSLLEILRENRLAQLATVDQQREIMRYMYDLNSWLERDVHNRQEEIHDVQERVDNLGRYLTVLRERVGEPASPSDESSYTTDGGDIEVRIPPATQPPGPWAATGGQSWVPSGQQFVPPVIPPGMPEPRHFQGIVPTPQRPPPQVTPVVPPFAADRLQFPTGARPSTEPPINFQPYQPPPPTVPFVPPTFDDSVDSVPSIHVRPPPRPPILPPHVPSHVPSERPAPPRRSRSASTGSPRPLSPLSPTARPFIPRPRPQLRRRRSRLDDVHYLPPSPSSSVTYTTEMDVSRPTSAGVPLRDGRAPSRPTHMQYSPGGTRMEYSPGGPHTEYSPGVSGRSRSPESRGWSPSGRRGRRSDPERTRVHVVSDYPDPQHRFPHTPSQHTDGRSNFEDRYPPRGRHRPPPLTLHPLPPPQQQAPTTVIVNQPGAQPPMQVVQPPPPSLGMHTGPPIGMMPTQQLGGMPYPQQGVIPVPGTPIVPVVGGPPQMMMGGVPMHQTIMQLPTESSFSRSRSPSPSGRRRRLWPFGRRSRSPSRPPQAHAPPPAQVIVAEGTPSRRGSHRRRTPSPPRGEQIQVLQPVQVGAPPGMIMRVSSSSRSRSRSPDHDRSRRRLRRRRSQRDPLIIQGSQPGTQAPLLPPPLPQQTAIFDPMMGGMYAPPPPAMLIQRSPSGSSRSFGWGWHRRRAQSQPDSVYITGPGGERYQRRRYGRSRSRSTSPRSSRWRWPFGRGSRSRSHRQSYTPSRGRSRSRTRSRSPSDRSHWWQRHGRHHRPYRSLSPRSFSPPIAYQGYHGPRPPHRRHDSYWGGPWHSRYRMSRSPPLRYPSDRDYSRTPSYTHGRYSRSRSYTPRYSRSPSHTPRYSRSPIRTPRHSRSPTRTARPWRNRPHTSSRSATPRSLSPQAIRASPPREHAPPRRAGRVSGRHDVLPRSSDAYVSRTRSRSPTHPAIQRTRVNVTGPLPTRDDPGIRTSRDGQTRRATQPGRHRRLFTPPSIESLESRSVSPQPGRRPGHASRPSSYSRERLTPEEEAHRVRRPTPPREVDRETSVSPPRHVPPRTTAPRSQSPSERHRPSSPLSHERSSSPLLRRPRSPSPLPHPGARPPDALVPRDRSPPSPRSIIVTVPDRRPGAGRLREDVEAVPQGRPRTALALPGPLDEGQSPAEGSVRPRPPRDSGLVTRLPSLVEPLPPAIHPHLQSEVEHLSEPESHPPHRPRSSRTRPALETPPRQVAIVPFDFPVADESRAQLDELNAVASRLEGLSRNAGLSDNQREREFRAREDAREAKFLQSQEERDAEARQRAAGIWDDIETTLHGAPMAPAKEETGPLAPGSLLDAPVVRFSPQTPTTQAMSDVLDTVREEREARQREREKMAEERAALAESVARERDQIVNDKDARIQDLEEQIARARREMADERHRRAAEYSEMRERARQELAERDEFVRAQLADLTALLQDQRGMIEEEAAVMDQRDDARRARRVSTDLHQEDLRNMLTGIHDDFNAVREANEQDGLQKKEALRKIVDDMRRQNNEQRELLQSLTEGWVAECDKHRREIIDVARTNAGMQVPWNVQGYLDEFSRALATEVRMLLGEVGKIREERRALQHEIADLLCLKKKYAPGGEHEPDWKPPGAPTDVPIGIHPHIPMTAMPPLPELPPTIPSAWKRVSDPRRRKLRRKAAAAPPPPARPESWATWIPARETQMTPPAVQPTLGLGGSERVGLFGPPTTSESSVANYR